MKRKNIWKKVLVIVLVIVLLAGAGGGAWMYFGQSSEEPVYVYPFNYVGMTEYWGDSQESYGPVTTDRIQTVYLSDTQTVTEVLVTQGQEVKKGDLLMTFDTTLSDLALERARLDVEKLKLQLEDEKTRLREINSMRPMVIPVYDSSTEENENQGTALKGDYQISTQSKYDGSSKELALICWIRGDKTVDAAILEAIRQQAEAFQTENAKKEAEGTLIPSSASAMPEDTTSTEPETTEPETTEPETTEPETTEPETTEPETTEPETTEPETTEPETTEPETTEPETTEPETTEPETTEPETTEPETTEPETTEPETTEPETTEPETTEPETTEPETTEPEIVVITNQYYVIFKVTSGNMSLGATQVWQGLLVTRNPDTNTFTFQFFNADAIQDHTLAAGEEPEKAPEIDFGSGYTSAQIAQMRTEQEKTIRDLEFEIKMAEAEYKIMQTEVNDGNVYAQIDGTVISLLSEDEAKMMMQPILKVSGGGGFYVEGTVSELEKDKMAPGQEVTVNDWNTGMVYTGTIESIGDFPSSDGYWNGMGNPNASYYPFRVFVDSSADLQEGRYVSVMYSAGEAEHGVYLQNPFLRTEGGESYVYVMGAGGTIEKRYVTTGKSLWGSYTEIKEGLSAEDLIAFPYGKNVVEGAPAEESDYSTLYE